MVECQNIVIPMDYAAINSRANIVISTLFRVNPKNQLIDKYNLSFIFLNESGEYILYTYSRLATIQDIRESITICDNLVQARKIRDDHENIYKV